MDDLLLLSDSPGQLIIWRQEISQYLLNNLKLRLHPGKDKYGRVSEGINFVGYIVRPSYTLSRKRVVDNLKTKLHYFNSRRCVPGRAEVIRITAVVNSYYGHFKHADCYNLRKNLYEKHFGMLKKYLIPINDFQSFKIT